MRYFCWELGDTLRKKNASAIKVCANFDQFSPISHVLHRTVRAIMRYDLAIPSSGAPQEVSEIHQVVNQDGRDVEIYQPR